MRPETRLQREILAHIKEKGFWPVHVPNGSVLAGNKSARARQMNALKADGLKVGFPDLSIYNSEGRIGHIEVKTEKGRQSEAQKTCQAILESMGHLYAIARSVDDVDEALKAWGWLV